MKYLVTLILLTVTMCEPEEVCDCVQNTYQTETILNSNGEIETIKKLVETQEGICFDEVEDLGMSTPDYYTEVICE